MTGGDATASLAWTSVYAGLAAFFLVVGPRFRGRGYEMLGMAMACIALASLGLWLALSSASTPRIALGGRFLIWGATLAPAFNTHFALRFTRRDELERWAVLGYLLALVISVADLGFAFQHLHAGVNADSLSLMAPSGALIGPMKVLFGVHLLVAAVLLGQAVRGGMLGARWPFAMLVVLGPVVIFDYGNVLTSGRNYYITEGVTWLYGLVVVASLLSELRGTEGLLERTTSSLAERTAELQNSYAELDFVHTELSRKEQLAAVGELAASIAHEVRNPLAIIMNAASGLRRKTISEADKATLLSIVDEESARLNQLVTELLRFARPVAAAPVSASLLDICKQVQAAAPETHRVVIAEPSDAVIDHALVDTGLFRLALDNLLANAIQATPEGGEIELSLARTQLADGSPAVSLEVRDHGVGMSAADLERCRKPFFTTRPRGTGLGLAIVDRILDAHGGELALESQLGAGTLVTLRVPLDTEFAAPSRTGSKSPAQRRRLRSFSGVSSEPPSVRGEPERGSVPAAEAPPPPSFRGN